MTSAIEGVKSAFKKADTSLQKAQIRYKKVLRSVYMYRYEDFGGNIYNAYDLLVSDTGAILGYATDKAFTFFRRRRNKLYVKPQNGNNATFAPYAFETIIENGEFVLHQRYIGQDYLDLRALELAIEDAIDKRNEIVFACKNETGINLYSDEAWKN